MRTKEQIENKLEQLIDKMNEKIIKDTRLTTSEKSMNESLFIELKEEIHIARERALFEIENLRAVEMYSETDTPSGTIILFRPRNSL